MGTGCELAASRAWAPRVPRRQDPLRTLPMNSFSLFSSMAGCVVTACRPSLAFPSGIYKYQLEHILNWGSSL